MKKDFWAGLIMGIAATALVVSSGYAGYRSAMGKSRSVISERSNYAKLLSLERLIDRDYLYEIDEDAIVEGIYAGLVSGLGDSYSRYYTAEEYAEESISSSGTYVGIGIVMQKTEEGYVEVVEVYEGSFAQAADMAAGDVILTMDGEDVSGMDLSEIAAEIKEEGRTEVTFDLLREDQELTVTVEVSNVEIPSVHWEMMDNRIGYIRIDEFKGVTTKQFTAAYEELQTQGMCALIVDLRNNPGGFLNVVCDILRQILPEGIIVYSEDKNGNREEEICDGANEIQIPMAVLVNESSASASEIFAGAVQDYGIGTIIGTTTYGKGVVQTIHTLQDGSALKLTTSHYYTPNGNDIHGVGVTPDIEVAENEEGEEDAPLAEALQLLVKSIV